MIELHKRAEFIPNEEGVAWHHFLGARFVGTLPQAGKGATMAIVMQAIQQQSDGHADVCGLIEYSSGESLPVISEFAGVLYLETRELGVREARPERSYKGRISKNGRVIALHESGQSKAIYLIHEETLAQLV